jgi:hypothetical protein
MILICLILILIFIIFYIYENFTESKEPLLKYNLSILYHLIIFTNH